MSLALAKPCLPNLWLAQLTDNACNAPDLLPTDITGTNIWVPKAANLNIPGPVFANIVLADEIALHPHPIRAFG